MTHSPLWGARDSDTARIRRLKRLRTDAVFIREELEVLEQQPADPKTAERRQRISALLQFITTTPTSVDRSRLLDAAHHVRELLRREKAHTSELARRRRKHTSEAATFPSVGN